MEKNIQKTVAIDFERWTTQRRYAEDNGYSIQRVNNWIRRNQIKHRKIAELDGIILVERKYKKIN